MLSRFSHVQLFDTLWTIAHQAPLSMGFSRQEYWTEFPCPPPGDFPNPGIKPASLTSPALAGRFFTTSTTKSMYRFNFVRCCQICLQIDYIRWHSHQQHRRQLGLWTQKVWIKSWVPLDSCGTHLQCPHQKPSNAMSPRRTWEVCSTGWSSSASLPHLQHLPYRTVPCCPSRAVIRPKGRSGCESALP